MLRQTIASIAQSQLVGLSHCVEWSRHGEEHGHSGDEETGWRSCVDAQGRWCQQVVEGFWQGCAIVKQHCQQTGYVMAGQ